MSGTLRVFDPESTDEETRRLSRLAQKCWSPLTIVYNPLKAGSIDSTDVVPHDKAIVRAQNADFVPSKRIQGRPECTIFVGNLSAKTTARSLEEEFSRYGRVVKAKVIEDIITGRSRGYGFVEFSIEGEALKAYDCSNRTWLDGNKIFVDMECGRLLPGWVPRRLGGGFNGRKESGQLRFGCRERPFKKPIKLLSEREINRYFNEILGRKVQNEEKKDFDPKVVRTEEVDTEGRRELREGIHEDADTQISGEKEKKELKHKERERHREHKKKKRYSRSDYEDEEEETKRTLEKRFVDPSLICIKEKPTKDSVTDDGNGDMKSDSSTAGNFEMGVKKEEPWDEYKDSRKYRKHKEKGRHSRSDCEDEVKERKRTHKKRDDNPNLILFKEEDTTCSVTEDPDIYRDKEELQNHRKHRKKRRLREEDDGERISKKRKKKNRTSPHEDGRRRRDEQSGEET